MATPNYKGRGQPAGDSAGWLGSWLGGTPSYQGAGTPASRSSAFGGAAPAYKPAPSTAAPPDGMTSAESAVCGPIAIVIPREVIDQQ